MSRLPADFRLVAHANVTTNFKFRQAFSDTFRAATSPQEESVVFLTQNRDSFSANFTFQRQEVFYPGRSVVIRESPTLEYFSLGKPLPRLPLIFYLRSSVDGLSRTDALIETPKIVQRFDVFPSIALRLPSLAGFSVMPSVGVRDTFYGAGIAYGPEPAAVTEHLNRKYFDVEVDVQDPHSRKRVPRLVRRPDQARCRADLEVQDDLRNRRPVGEHHPVRRTGPDSRHE